MNLIERLAEKRSPSLEFLLSEVVAITSYVDVKAGETFTVSLKLLLDGEPVVLEYTFSGPIEIWPTPLVHSEADPPMASKRGLFHRIKAAFKGFLQ